MSLLLGRGPLIQDIGAGGSPPGAGSPPSNTWEGRAIPSSGSEWYSAIGSLNYNPVNSDFGTAGNTYPHGYNNPTATAMCLDDTYVFTQWRKLGTPKGCYFRTFSRSGTAFTGISSLYDASNPWTYYTRGLAWMSSTKILVSGSDGICVYTFSSGVLTRNTGGAVNSDTSLHKNSWLETIDEDVVIGIGRTNTGSPVGDLVVQCYTVSGTTVTANGETVLVSEPTTGIYGYRDCSIARLNDTHFIVCYCDNGNSKHILQVCKIDGSYNVSTVGSPFELSASNAYYYPKLHKTSYSAVGGSHQLYWTADDDSSMVHCGIQVDAIDYTITAGSITTGSSDKQGGRTCIATSDEYIVFCYSGADSDWFIQVLEYSGNTYQGASSSEEFSDFGVNFGNNYRGYMDWYDDDALYVVFYGRPYSKYYTKHTVISK